MSAVVLVDDEPALTRILGLILDREGIPCVTFNAPEQAIEYIDSHDVGLVICDYRMATMNGLMMLARVTRAVKCIVMTGELASEGLRGEDPRIVEVLQKPIPPEILLATIRAYLP